jgi:hypothetical protein
MESPVVKSLLGNCEVRSSDANENEHAITSAEVSPSGQLPEFCIAVDGSFQEVPVNNGFPGAHVAYVTLSSVLLDVKKMRELDAHRPVNPRQFQSIEKAESFEMALPGCNVVLKGMTSPQAAFRKVLFELFASIRELDGGESLLETYQALLAYKPASADGGGQKCPYETCQNPDRAFSVGQGEYLCGCAKQLPLYSTDSLRIHEGMNPAGTNGAMVAEVMQALERVWLVHVLRVIERKDYLHLLGRIALVLDGPLAVFGHPAWLSNAIQNELARINAKVLEKTGKDMLILGIEKSGVFVSHFEMLDKHTSGESGKVPSQAVYLLSDSYIKHNVIFSDSDKPYGSQTYFGRKFFYKTASGAMIVASLPFLRNEHKRLATAEPEQFPRLADALSLLDQLQSSRYPNAVVPLISAHAEAALPMNLGRRLLEELARELVSRKN